MFKRNFSVNEKKLGLYQEALPQFAERATIGTTCESCYKSYYSYRRSLKTSVKRGKEVIDIDNDGEDDVSVTSANNSKKGQTTSSSSSEVQERTSSDSCHASSSSEEPVGMCGKGVQKANLDFNFDETTTTAAEKARSIKQWLDMKNETNFKPVTTIDLSEANEEIIDFYLYKLGQPIVLTNSLELLAKGHMEMTNIPVTSSNLEQMKKKQAELFHLNYLRDCVGDFKVFPRDNTTFKDFEMTMKQYITLIQKDNDITAPNRKLLYGKDMTCPKQWRSYLFDNPKFPDKLKYKGPKDILANTNKNI